MEETGERERVQESVKQGTRSRNGEGREKVEGRRKKEECTRWRSEKDLEEDEEKEVKS